MTQQSPVDYWNKHLEHNALRSPPHGRGPDTDAGAFLATLLEAAGDIIRELSHGQYADYNYIFEKFNRVKNNLIGRDWRGPLSSREDEALLQVISDIWGLPADTPLLNTLKEVLLGIAYRNPWGVRNKLDILRSQLEEMDLGIEPLKGELTVKIPPPRGAPSRPKKVAVKAEIPRTLTMEDYERDWKPKDWQLLPIGPTATWRQDWGEWEAIRDIVQNALDESEAYQFGYDALGLWISDKGKGVGVADFLLGPPKLKPQYARGQHGEGMKIAALALLRMGYPIHIETVGREIWMIFIEQEVNGRTNMLAALWRKNGFTRGTTIHIIGYKDSAFEDRFAVNLQDRVIWKGASPVRVPKQRYNQLIDPYGLPRIFARDIYMRDINSPYSYNLWGFDLAPDRHAPKDENALWVDIGRLWATVDRVDLLMVFLQMTKLPPLIKTDESMKVNMDRWSMGEVSLGKHYADLITDNKVVWLEAWHNVMGENAVIRTHDKWDNVTRHLGYEPVSLNWSIIDTLAKAIPTDQEIKEASQEKLRETEVVPDEKLDRQQMAHLNLAREIAKSVFPGSPLSGVYAAIIPPASDRVRTAGLYGTTTQTVYISLDMLYRGKPTIDTLIHELAHHRQWRRTGEAEDLTESHATAMTSIAASVIHDLAQGKFVGLLKEVTW